MPGRIEKPTATDPLAALLSLRQHRRGEQRSPHKPLLVLLALGRLAATGSSAVPWSVAEHELAALIAEFGRPTRTGRAQSAAYPFTHLRSDGVWQLDQNVPMDLVGPLHTAQPVGRLDARLEALLLADPDTLNRTARVLVDDQFPATLTGDVLDAVGLDPQAVREAAPGPGTTVAARRRDPRWRAAVLTAWDRQCAFCGYDGELGGAPVGVEAAHVHWWGFGGPDELDNGLALCVLHHKLFDLGALGLTPEHRVRVSAAFTARTPSGKAVYGLHGRPLTPRRGTELPATEHLAWHASEVFKGEALAA